MQGFLDFAYAAKAWAGAVVFAVGQVGAAVQLAVADEAISLTEAKGIGLLVTEAVTLVVAFRTIFKTTNKPSPGV